jgi:hypothetical protein
MKRAIYKTDDNVAYLYDKVAKSVYLFVFWLNFL